MELGEVPMLGGRPVEGDVAMPYHRIWRPCRKGPNSGYNSHVYMSDHEYAQMPMNYTRPFLSLQKEVLSLFEYIEPCDINLDTFSYRIQQLLMRICVEIEANFKAIFNENKFTIRKEEKWNIRDYKLINTSHHLSSFKIKFPVWEGCKETFQPFDSWAQNKSLQWYRAYNMTKHSRIKYREEANFFNMLSAFSALAVLLSAQFGDETYEPGLPFFSANGSDTYYGDVDYALGGYLIIEYPIDWADTELYNFEWDIVKDKPNKFGKYDYDALSARTSSQN